MTDNLNIKGNLHECNKDTAEVRKDPGGNILPFYEEVTVTKTEVKEESYDLEMPVDEMVFANVKEEYISLSEYKYNPELMEGTEQSLNENHDIGSCDFKGVDLQENKYRCGLCHSNFNKEIQLRWHFKQCPFTKKKIFQKGIHLKENNTDKKYRCTQCMFTTCLRSNFIRHIGIHDKFKPFKCTYKNCKCPPEQSLSCKCNMCGYATTAKHTLNRHVLAKHNAKSKKYQCIYTNEKPFKCPYKNCKCTPDEKQCCGCNTCRYAAAYKSNLIQHILMRHSSEPKRYKCKDCKFTTHMKASLVIHNRIHTGDRPFKCAYKDCKCLPEQDECCKCDTCGYAAISSGNLKNHILVKHNAESKKYHCSYCNYASHTKKYLALHNRIHTGDKPFKCTYKNCKCIPGQNEPCRCDTCEYTATRKDTLQRHVLVKHSSEPKKYKCSECKYATYWKSNLAQHIHTHTYNCKCTPEQKEFCKCNTFTLVRHNNDILFKCTYQMCTCIPDQNESCKCDTCGYATTNSGNLKNHLQVHNAEWNKYKCNVCKFVTGRKRDLTRHIRTHTNDRPLKSIYKDCKCIPGQDESCPGIHKCDTCEYSCKESDALQQLSKHTLESKKCSDDNFVTNEKSVLTRHINERPFKCTYKNCKCTPGQAEPCECNMCIYTASVKSNLDRHILVRHSAKPKKYKCRDCDYATHAKKSLESHIRTHTGDKPFKCTHKNCKCPEGQDESCKCDTCEYAATVKCNLDRHIFLKHNTKLKK